MDLQQAVLMAIEASEYPRCLQGWPANEVEKQADALVRTLGDKGLAILGEFKAKEKTPEEVAAENAAHAARMDENQRIYEEQCDRRRAIIAAENAAKYEKMHQRHDNEVGTVVTGKIRYIGNMEYGVKVGSKEHAIKGMTAQDKGREVTVRVFKFGKPAVLIEG